MRDAEGWWVLARDEDGRATAAYRIDVEAGLAWVQFSGTLAPPIIREMRQTIRGDSDFRPSFDGLIDLRSVARVGLSASDLPGLTSGPATRGERTGRMALVIGHDTSRVLFGRLYEAFTLLRSSRDTKIFETVDEALAWLQE